MADPLAPGAVGEFTVQPHALRGGELPLAVVQRVGRVEQAGRLPLLRNDFVEKREVVPEKNDGLRMVQPRIAREILPERRRHGGHVLVGEAKVGAEKAGVARFHGGNAQRTGGRVGDPVPGDDLFRNRLGAVRRGRDAGERDESLQPRHGVVEQSAVLDDVALNAPRVSDERVERDLLAVSDLLDQGEIRRCEETDVRAILPVDALDVLPDDDAEPRGALGVRRSLPARPFSTPLPRHRAHEAALPDVVAADRALVAAKEAHVRVFPQLLVEVVADPARRDFIGRDVVAQGDRGVPFEVLPRELAADEVRVFGKEKDPPLEAHGRWTPGHLGFEQMFQHVGLRPGQKIGMKVVTAASIRATPGS